jgi:FkbM family methyltransferase
MTMNSRILRLTHMLGSTVLTGKRASDVAMAMRLRHLFARYEIDTVIDVGANQGQYRDFLRDRVNFRGQIESFEPIPELAHRLRARAASDARWTVHPYALGARSGEVAINVMATTEFSSFLAPLQSADAHVNEMNAVVGTVMVPVSTLDAEFAGKEGLHHTYLKLDTQGFDLEVLHGGERTVSEIPALQTEVSFQPLYQGMPGYVESIQAFERHGFSVADFFLITTDVAQRALEFDCVMVRCLTDHPDHP